LCHFFHTKEWFNLKIFSFFFIPDGIALPFNHRQKVFPNGTLIVHDLERSTDEGKYTCIARQNKDGKSASRSFHVRIAGKFFSFKNYCF